MILQPIAAIMLGRLLATVIVAAPFASQSWAQPPDSRQAAIRAALTKWTEDFNPGMWKRCAVFLFRPLYDYSGQPERNYKEICDLLHRSLTDRTRRYAYSLAIKNILILGDLVAVRLIWTLTVTKSDRQAATVAQEYGIDVFRREPDDRWRIIKFIAYMMLDTGTVHLKSGGVVVQQATNHAWPNHSKEPCRTAFVLMDSQEP
jgi:hypothetical protein